MLLILKTHGPLLAPYEEFFAFCERQVRHWLALTMDFLEQRIAGLFGRFHSEVDDLEAARFRGARVLQFRQRAQGFELAASR